jgi:uroporphyrinogen-III decarboxylase
VSLQIDFDEIERRKQVRRDLWNYRKIDHIPVVMWLRHTFGYSLHEQLQSTTVQFQVNIERIRKSLRVLPDDYIPYARVTLGYMTIATMFGLPVYWGDDPDIAPGVAAPLITDLEQVYSLPRPSLDSGLASEGLQRLRYHAKNLPANVYLTGLDLGGPLGSCKDLVMSNLFYTSFYDNPAALHHLLDLVTDVQLDLYRAVVQAAGGLERITSIDFNPVWAPEEYKSFVSDDVCAALSPDLFKNFSRPYNNRLYQPWGSGLLHNCGPHPAKFHYLEHTPRLKGMNCSYRFSHAEFPEFRQIFAGWGVVEVLLDQDETAEEMLAAFHYMMETFAPDTFAIPVCMLGDGWSDSDITDLYWEMRKIAVEYTTRMASGNHPNWTRK